jgi:membrane-associated phospholipid phosphatase
MHQHLVARSPAPQPTTDEESRFGRSVNYFPKYSKGLPHDDAGEVSPDAYEQLLRALSTPSDRLESVLPDAAQSLAPTTLPGVARSLLPTEDDTDTETDQFEAVPEPGARPLTNPEASMSYNMVGIDPNGVYAPAPPAFDSAEMAAELVELYWQALLRDIPFRVYDDHSAVAEAASELAGLRDFTGPTDPATLFRGTLAGVDAGPRVSQFLYKDFERGVRRHDQRIRVLKPATEYMTDYDEWLQVQNGEVPNGGLNRTLPGGPSASDADIRTDRRRYIVTGRDLATYVIENISQQPYMNAAFILQNSEQYNRDPLDENLPIDPNVPAGFVDYGRSAYQSLLGGIVQTHKHAAWYHKWRVHRRLRPEEAGGRLHHIRSGATIDGESAADRYPLDDQLLDSTALARTETRFDTALLPQAYPEGSPTHPSYPGGHAVTAGSCTTVLKAYFDGDRTLPDPVRPTTDNQDRFTELEPVSADLTIRGELHKLAANMSYARSWAGIHYRSDTTTGLRIGERIATSVLTDQLRAKPTDPYGSDGSFSFQTFDGVDVTVTADGVTPDTAFDPPLF